MIRFPPLVGHEDHGQPTGPVPTALPIPFLPTALAFCLLLFIAILGASPVSADESAHLSVKVLVAYHSLSGNTERMAEAVVDGAKSVPGTVVVMKRVGQVTADDLFSSDAVVVGSPVYWSNMSGEVKTFLDNWQFKFGVFPDFKMKNKVGAAFATGGQISSGKEVTMLTILAAMLGNQMIVVSGGGAFGASATTEGDSPGIDNKELADARALGQRVAEVAAFIHSAPTR
ncbi:flavodoxin family protein [Nitrospira lenta]|uniref:NAD(P)H:quinone oxidoreductase WrbA n=1 Tax=Nitrospira lenta TaxID=1436998 RepID=A0A330L715_9BACT|nr:NAD(P)H:quinone oxidoreductase WrbA [Nitrospira lenta]